MLYLCLKVQWTDMCTCFSNRMVCTAYNITDPEANIVEYTRTLSQATLIIQILHC